MPISESTSLFNRYCINIISSNKQISATYASQSLYQESVLYCLGLGVQLTTNETINQHFVPFVTGYGKTNHSRHFVETEINTLSERTFIADHNGAFIFFQSDFPVQSYELLNANNMQVDFDRTRYL